MTAPWLTPDQSAGGSPRTRKPRKPDPVTEETRTVVRGRSGGVCEIEGCGASATHMHHRQLRRFGQHGPANLLHVCGTCHTRIHGHVRFSLDQGWIVSQYDEPALREVLRRGEWVWLGGGGELLAFPPPLGSCS